MSPEPSLAARLGQLAAAWLARAEAGLPDLLAAAGLLMAGLAAGWLVATVARRLIGALDLTIERVLGPGRAARLRLQRHAGWIARVLFWTVWLVFAAAAAQTLGGHALTPWIAPLVDHLPALLAGVLIIGAGVLLARVVGDLVLGGGTMAQAQRQVLARAAQTAVVAGAILVGADQMGVRLTFLAIFAGTLGLALAGGVIVAVSLGARHHVANLIGMQQVRSRVRPGQRIRIAGHEGRVLQFQADALLIETVAGRAALPGHLFSREPLLELRDGQDGQDGQDGADG
jgi:hypothetical protein